MSPQQNSPCCLLPPLGLINRLALVFGLMSRLELLLGLMSRLELLLGLMSRLELLSRTVGTALAAVADVVGS